MSTGTAVRFNPFSTAFRQDPYPIYEQLRSAAPVHRTLGMWVLTRHDDVQTVLRDSTFGASLIPRLVSAHAKRLGHNEIDRVDRLGATSLVFTDDPDHARLRALVNRVFTTRAVDDLRPRVRARADALLKPGELDLITDFAAPLPISVMCDWMDLPDAIRRQVGGWTHDIRFLLEPGMMTAADFNRVRTVVDAFTEVLDEVVSARTPSPGTDLISRMISARTTSGDALDHDEIVVLCIMCFVAGNETTTALIGNGTLALVRNPEQEDLVRHHRDLASSVVDETLRYDSPLQLTKRVATRDAEIRGRHISAGDHVLLCLGAANRDPGVFDQPDYFDITRSGTSAHLAFGYGMHRCVGAMLARMQAEVAFEALFAAGRRITARTEDLQWQRDSLIVRGLAHLPVTL